MQTEKKGLSPIAWIGIGCAGVAVLAIIGLVVFVYWGVGKAKDFVKDPSKAAELVIDLNPDLEHVSTDKDAGTMEVKNVKTGEVMTLNFDQITQGDFSIQGEDGEVFSIDTDNGNGGATIRTNQGETQFGGDVNLDNVPAWVVQYPNTTKSTTAMTNTNNGKPAGMLAFETNDSPSAISEYYKAKLEAAGFSVDERTMNAAGNSQVVITANNADTGQSMNVIASENNGKRTFVINYQEK